MTTSFSPRRFPRRGGLNLVVGSPNWLPLTDRVVSQQEGFTVTIFRVFTALGDNRFRWGPFRETEAYAKRENGTPQEVRPPIVSVIDDSVEVTFWSKTPEGIESGIFEVCIEPFA